MSSGVLRGPQLSGHPIEGESVSAPLDQLQGLLQRVGSAFDVSDVRQLARTEGFRWNYSLITGACRAESPLIVGLNWGASDGVQYDPQCEIKPSSWEQDDLGSFNRVQSYMDRYLPNVPLETASQTNFCFFRSKNESDISDRDLARCQPLFFELLELLHPTVVLGFSSRLRDYLLRTDQEVIDPKTKTIGIARQGGTRTFFAVVGKLRRGGAPVAFLPHPNYPLRRCVREQLWKFCAEAIVESR